jgi:hypothetical protein
MCYLCGGFSFQYFLVANLSFYQFRSLCLWVTNNKYVITLISSLLRVKSTLIHQIRGISVTVFYCYVPKTSQHILNPFLCALLTQRYFRFCCQRFLFWTMQIYENYRMDYILNFGLKKSSHRITHTSGLLRDWCMRLLLPVK